MYVHILRLKFYYLQSTILFNFICSKLIMVVCIIQLSHVMRNSNGEGKGKVDGDGPSLTRTVNWDDDQIKFMLDWCIDYMKNQHAGFKFKKQHHMKCADALNKEFAMGGDSCSS